MNSKNGMLTWVWGPVLWYVLHYFSFCYSSEPSNIEAQIYYDMIYYLQYVLPCGACRSNYKSNISEFPLKSKHLENTCTFAAWVYNFHNLINKMTKKEDYVPPTFENVTKTYNASVMYDSMVKIAIIPKDVAIERNHNIVNKCIEKKLDKQSRKDSIALPFWFVLLCICFNYPLKPTKHDKYNYAQFYNSCFKIYKNTTSIKIKHISTHDSCLKNRHEFSQHIVQLLGVHNGKQYGHKELSVFIEKFRANCVRDGALEGGCTQSLSGKKCKAVVSILSNQYQCQDFMNYIVISPGCCEI